MSEIAPVLTPVPRKPRPRRKWALALVAVFAAVFLHWLLFQWREVVPGVIARPVGPCDASWCSYKMARWFRLSAHGRTEVLAVADSVSVV